MAEKLVEEMMNQIKRMQQESANREDRAIERENLLRDEAKLREDALLLQLSSMGTRTAQSISTSSVKPLEVEDGDMSNNWKLFKDNLMSYFALSGIPNNETDASKKQYHTLMLLIGEKAKLEFHNFGLKEEDKAKAIEDILEIIEKSVKRDLKVLLARGKFNEIRQQTGESCQKLLKRIRESAEKCKFDTMTSENACEKMVRDRLIFAFQDPKLKEKLFEKEEETLTIEQVMIIGETSEQSTKFLEMHDQKSAADEINMVKKQHRAKQECSNCGYDHTSSKKCPAEGKSCSNCDKSGHFAKKCRTAKVNKSKPKQKKSVKALREDCESSSGNESDNTSRNVKMICTTENNMITANIDFRAKGENHQMKCQLDTGAQTNVMGVSYLRKLGYRIEDLKPSNAKLRGFSGEKIPVMGKKTVRCNIGDEKFRVNFEIVKQKHMPLIGGKDCIEMGLITCKKIKNLDEECRTDVKNAKKIIKKYSYLFEGLGTIAEDVKLEINLNVKPTIQSPRRIPVKVQKDLKKELEEMVSAKIITPVHEHTEWVSNITFPERDGKRRLCLDPVKLNGALLRPNYQFPKLEEILPELGKAKVFTKIDLKKGYWQVKLDEDSSKLTTFWSPYGRYRFIRMPFGISSASEIFQMRLFEIMDGLTGTYVMADDILIVGSGETRAEAIANHDRNLEKTLQRLDENNARLNGDKLELCKEEVTFFGHLLTNRGLKPDPEKVEAIKKMPHPEDKKAVERFIGTASYMAKFIPGLSEKLGPLRELKRSDEEFSWTQSHQKAFESVKKAIAARTILKYFDKNKPVIIECDSSSFGIGGILKQDDEPVYFASRTMTECEKRYSQIEKELLSIVFACTRFDQYIYGCESVTVQNDHKPLERIHKKPIHEVTKRLQRMLMTLQRYRINIAYKPGKEMTLADALSRAPLEAGRDEKETDLMKIFEIRRIKDIRVTDERIDQIRNETSRDDVMQQLRRYVKKGWPSEIKKMPADESRTFFKYRDEMAFEEGLLFKNDRIVIPQKLRADMLKRLHGAHYGIESCLNLAKDTMFWPGITQQIKDKVLNCEVCLQSGSNQRHQQMQSHPIPEFPFQQVSLDCFEVNINNNRNDYVVMTDHYSDFFEYKKLNKVSSETIISFAKDQFGRYGIPVKVTTDGASYFLSEKFREFGRKWGFRQTVSTPNHQQANGKAESAVKAAKKLIRKSAADGSDEIMNLLLHRNTPNKVGSSPAQRLLARRTRCDIPTTTMKLKPQVIDKVPEKIEENKKRAKKYYDRGTRKLPELEIGQSVFVKLKLESKEWKKGVVTEQKKDRAYTVNVKDKHYIRDREFIRPYEQQEDLLPYIPAMIPSHNLENNETEKNQPATPAEPIEPEAPARRHLDQHTAQQPIVRRYPVRSRQPPKFFHDE